MSNYLRAPRRYGVSIAALIFSVAMVASACASPTPSPSASASPAASASPVSELPFPRTISDDGGIDITISTAPQRIVALSPASVEVLAAIGLTDRVVGVAACSCMPKALSKVKVVADYTATNVEKIVALNPDLVFVGGSGFTPQEAIDALRATNITVVTIDPLGVDGVLHSIRLIGDAAGASVAAAALAAEAQGEIAALAALVPANPRPAVFYEVDATGAIYGLSVDDYAAELITLAGGEPITSGESGVWEIDLESLVAAQPEVILLGDAAYGTTAEAVAARPGWGSMPAVVDGSIVAVDGDLITTPGPRIATALRALILAIHPELTLP